VRRHLALGEVDALHAHRHRVAHREHVVGVLDEGVCHLRHVQQAVARKANVDKGAVLLDRADGALDGRSDLELIKRLLLGPRLTRRGLGGRLWRRGRLRRSRVLLHHGERGAQRRRGGAARKRAARDAGEGRVERGRRNHRHREEELTKHVAGELAWELVC